MRVICNTSAHTYRPCSQIALGEIAEEIYAEFSRILKQSELPDVHGCAAIPWVYGDRDYKLGDGCAWEETKRLALCGDFAFNGRLQGAWLSGQAAANKVLESL